MSRQGLCSVGESGRRVMVFPLFLGTVPRGEGPAIEIAPGWPLAAKSAYADWVLSGVPPKKEKTIMAAPAPVHAVRRPFMAAPAPRSPTSPLDAPPAAR